MRAVCCIVCVSPLIGGGMHPKQKLYHLSCGAKILQVPAIVIGVHGAVRNTHASPQRATSSYDALALWSLTRAVQM